MFAIAILLLIVKSFDSFFHPPGRKGSHLTIYICIQTDASSMDVFKAMFHAEVICALHHVSHPTITRTPDKALILTVNPSCLFTIPPFFW